MTNLEGELEELKEEIRRNRRSHSDINKRLDEEFLSEIQMLKSRLERSNNIEVQKLQVINHNFWRDQKSKNLYFNSFYKTIILMFIKLSFGCKTIKRCSKEQFTIP